MPFYDLTKPQRQQLVAELHQKLLKNLQTGKTNHILKVFSDEDPLLSQEFSAAALVIFE